MSKKEQLEKEFTKLMNWRDKVFQVFLALLSGEAIMLYSVLSGEKPLYVLLLVIAGFIVLLLIGFKIKLLNEAIDKNIMETEKV